MADTTQQPKTCSTCKHWLPFMPHWKPECENLAVLDMMEADGGASFETPADFGCTLWAAKDGEAPPP